MGRGRREGAIEKVGYYSQTTWGMFTEFNNSKWHHFIGFMDGCVSHSLTMLHTHSQHPLLQQLPRHPLVQLYEKWQGVCMEGSWILLQEAIQSYRLKLLTTHMLMPPLHLNWNIMPVNPEPHPLSEDTQTLNSTKMVPRRVSYYLRMCVHPAMYTVPLIFISKRGIVPVPLRTQRSWPQYWL